MIADPIWTPVIERPDLHVTLQLTEGLFEGQELFVIASTCSLAHRAGSRVVCSK